jgi:hypothetical protein
VVIGRVKMGPIRCPETSVNNYHKTPGNTPEDRRFHQRRGGSVKSRLILTVIHALIDCLCLLSLVIWGNYHGLIYMQNNPYIAEYISFVICWLGAVLWLGIEVVRMFGFRIV